MTRFFFQFLSLVHAALQRPSELPVLVERGGVSRGALIAALSITALAQATATYLLRDYYDNGAFLLIPLLALIYGAFAFAWAALLGCVADALVSRTNRERAGKAPAMIAVIIFSAMPNMFVVSSALVARFLSYPALITIPVQLGVFAWSIYITLKGLQYLYELNLRRAASVYLQGLALVLVFPGLALLFALLSAATGYAP